MNKMKDGGDWTRTNEGLGPRDLQSLAIATMRHPQKKNAGERT